MLKFFFKIVGIHILFSTKALQAFVVQKNVYENRILAYVEDSVITQLQVDHEMALFERKGFESIHSKEEVRSKILNAMIEKKIIVKEFERMKGQLPESYVQKRYDSIQKSRFNDDALNFFEALRRQGKTKLDYKEDLREEAIVECMHERNVIKPNTVSPLEIQNYYDLNRAQLTQGRQFNLDQITVKKENREAVEVLYKNFASHLSYEEIYQQVAQVPGVDAKRMDNLVEGDLVPMITEKVKKMAINAFDKEPIDFDTQLVFLGLRGIKEAHSLSLDEARKRIESVLLNEKYQLLRQNWVDRLKKKAYYVIL